ncbi:MAG: YdiY family protein [Gemmobacter sp.]
MKTMLTTGAIAALLLATAAPMALAQTTLTGTQALDDRLDDIDTAVRDDLRRGEDMRRFGNPEFRPGLSGSASLSYNAKRGSQDTQEFSMGARLRYAQGQFVQSIGMALDFAEANGTKSKEDVFGVYDAQYYFDDSFYGFILGRVATDGLADRIDTPDLRAGRNRTDAFIGVGPGYRIFNTPDVTWRVQAGIGYSFLENGLRQRTRETGYIASSRFFYKLSDSMFATNDTDVLKTKSALRVNNDLGLNFRMTDTFSTRVSYLTDYNDTRANKTDNKLGLSLVYSF